MNIEKFSGVIKAPQLLKKVDVPVVKEETKEVLKNTGKKVLTTLSCLAAIGYYLVHNKQNEKPLMSDAKPDESSGKDSGSGSIDGDDFGSSPVGGDDFGDDDGINPGYDGKTKVLLALTTDGRCVEIYELSDGRLISPADYHFPMGRSLDQLAFYQNSINDSFYGGVGSSISSVNASYSRPMEEEFSSGCEEDYYKRIDLMYRSKITETIVSLDGGEELLEELNKPENKEVFDAVYTRDILNNAGTISIATGRSQSDSILGLIRRNLVYAYRGLDGDFVRIEQNPLSEKIVSQIDERFSQIREHDEVLEEPQEYSSFDYSPVDYVEEEEEAQVVFA